MTGSSGTTQVATWDGQDLAAGTTAIEALNIVSGDLIVHFGNPAGQNVIYVVEPQNR